jgi:hypothetical protein
MDGVANDFLSSLIVAVDVAEFVLWTSIHFECASVMSKKIFPSFGPA